MRLFGGKVMGQLAPLRSGQGRAGFLLQTWIQFTFLFRTGAFYPHTAGSCRKCRAAAHLFGNTRKSQQAKRIFTSRRKGAELAAYSETGRACNSDGVSALRSRRKPRSLSFCLNRAPYRMLFGAAEMSAAFVTLRKSCISSEKSSSISGRK